MDNEVLKDFMNEYGLSAGERVVDAYRTLTDHYGEVYTVVVITDLHSIFRFYKTVSLAGWDLEVI